MAILTVKYKVLAFGTVFDPVKFDGDKKHEGQGNHDDAWFYEMNKESQDEYIKEHPNSKFAKNAKQTEIEPKKKLNKVKKIAGKMSDAIKGFNEEQRKFFTEGQHKPESEERRKLGDMIKDKSKGIAKAVKHEVKEWKLAANALRKLKRGEKLDQHDKAAMKAVAIHAGIVIGEMALTGGLAHGLAVAVPHLATGLLQHSAIVNFGKAAIYAKAEDEEADEALLEELIKMLGEGAAKADVKPEKWINAVKKGNAKKG